MLYMEFNLVEKWAMLQKVGNTMEGGRTCHAGDVCIVVERR